MRIKTQSNFILKRALHWGEFSFGSEKAYQKVSFRWSGGV